MKKVLLIVLGLVVVIIGGIAALAASRPEQYHIERSITASAAPTAVYAVLCDFNRYAEWSPFMKLDPNAKTTVTGDACQVGHHYAWNGNEDAGEGTMTISDLVSDQRIDIALVFTRPMPSTAKVTYTVKGDAGQSIVTWAMEGAHTNLGEKIFGMLFMERMLGPMFDEGLANVKALAEKSGS